MKARFITSCLIILSNTIFAQVERPKLVIGIVVDQMRWDYLYRYSNRYENGGFKRLLSEGFSCENTYIEHSPSYTAVGHSTIYTGSVPSIHGIVGNNFIIQDSGKSVYCTEDASVETVGSNSVAGKMSPRNLLASTVTDELKLATNFRSKVIGISLKDRGAILPAGHSADAAFWFDDVSDGWISSTYYMKSLPEWLTRFNKVGLVQKYLKNDWNTLYPIDTYTQSISDANVFETPFPGTSQTVFPYKTSLLMKQNAGLIRFTPYGSTLTLDLAKEAILNEQLGKDTIADFLAVSLSSTDYLGHSFGPNSVEMEDMYLRLDRDLSSFFSFLDETIGKGNYTLFLTSDHGSGHAANFLLDKRIPAGIFSFSGTAKKLNKSLLEKYKIPNLVKSVLNYQVHLNKALIAEKNLSESAIKQDCITFLEKDTAVAYALDLSNIGNANVPALLKNKVVNGFNRERCGQIQIILKPGWYNGYQTGVSHGAWHLYDTHIPFILMGWGIKQGKTYNMVSMSDIAATLSALLSMQAPNGCIGKPVTEILK